MSRVLTAAAFCAAATFALAVTGCDVKSGKGATPPKAPAQPVTPHQLPPGGAPGK